MAEFPAMPLWTDAYLGDTTHLTTIEHGAYFLLLVTMWRTGDCRLPDDDRLLARYTRSQSNQWRRLRPILEPFFVIEGGCWRQRRLTDEREAVQRFRQRQSEKGKKSGEARALKTKGRHLTGVKSGSPPVEPDGNRDRTYPTPTPVPLSNDNGGSSEIDISKTLFDQGVQLLTSKGKTESQARAIIAKWQRDFTDAPVLEAINYCRNATDPVSAIRDRLGKAKAKAEYNGI